MLVIKVGDEIKFDRGEYIVPDYGVITKVTKNFVDVKNEYGRIKRIKKTQIEKIY